MKKKIFRTYIINAMISGFYILKGIFTIISAKSGDNKSGFLYRVLSSDFFKADFTEAIRFLEKVLDITQNVMNTINLYVYGYPSLFTGTFALMLSSIGIFLLTKKQTKKTVGYYLTTIFSFILLGLLTLIYFIISRTIANIKK